MEDGKGWGGKWVGLGGEGWKERRGLVLGGLVEEYGVRGYWGYILGLFGQGLRVLKGIQQNRLLLYM